MRRPLFASAPDTSSQSSGNVGLFFDKFCDRWRTEADGRWTLEADKNDKKSDPPKQVWLRQVSRFRCDAQALAETYLRRDALARARGGHSITLRTTTAMVAGMGRANPSENGFNFHHVLGAFYLPGSSVKGVVASYALEWAPDFDPDEFDRIFGWPDGRDGSVGSVAFLDAIPLQSPDLTLDVLTPHQSQYRSDKGKSIPGDWNDPVPVPFLSIDPGVSMQFVVLPRRVVPPKEPDGTPSPEQDAQKAAQWLRDAAKRIGFGAKSASGYGRLGKASDDEASKYIEARFSSMRVLGHDGPLSARAERRPAAASQPAKAAPKKDAAPHPNTLRAREAKSFADIVALAAEVEATHDDWPAAAIGTLRSALFPHQTREEYKANDGATLRKQLKDAEKRAKKRES